MKIFLDIDGVLRSGNKNVEGSSPARMFECAIRQIQNKGTAVQIIISSSWREVKSLKSIKSLFAPDIAELIVSVTPVIQPDWREESPIRYQEIQSWLSEHKSLHEPWIAIDDRGDLFPWGLKNLLLIDSEKLFDARAAMNLQDKVKEL